MLIILGAIGIGLVWGWLAAGAGGRTRHALRTALILLFVTFLLAAAVRLLADWQSMAFFVGASAFTTWLHLAWRESLRERYGPSTTSSRRSQHA